MTYKPDPRFADFLDPIKLKAGKDDCPCCGKKMRAYAKTLDKRLVTLGYNILEYLRLSHKDTFLMNDVWGSEPDAVVGHRKICDANKLHYWGFIEQEEKGRDWFLTKKGFDFLNGEIQVPRTIWVFNDQVIADDDDMMHIGNVDERWQKTNEDYRSDWVPYRYKTVVNTSVPATPPQMAPSAPKMLTTVIKDGKALRIPLDEVTAFLEQNQGSYLP